MLVRALMFHARLCTYVTAVSPRGRAQHAKHALPTLSHDEYQRQAARAIVSGAHQEAVRDGIVALCKFGEHVQREPLGEAQHRAQNEAADSACVSTKARRTEVDKPRAQNTVPARQFVHSSCDRHAPIHSAVRVQARRLHKESTHECCGGAAQASREATSQTIPKQTAHRHI